MNKVSGVRGGRATEQLGSCTFVLGGLELGMKGVVLRAQPCPRRRASSGLILFFAPSQGCRGIRLLPNSKTARLRPIRLEIPGI